ncbi:MAG TPA: allene oxide cyclase family protein [Steroidobacteraceae bacterium]
MNRLQPLMATLALLVPLAATAGERLHVIEHAVNETTTHVAAGAKADSVGDLLTFANPVFDATNKTQLGTDHGWCIRVVVGKSWECFWTLLLKEGRITVAGPFYDSGDSVFAITGGTGKYVGAKGQMTLHDRGTTPTSYDFIYELL